MTISASAFLDLNKIAATPERPITARNLVDYFGVHSDVLINSGALVKFANLNAVDDRSDYEGRMAEVVRMEGHNARFSQAAGWGEVDPLEIPLHNAAIECELESFLVMLISQNVQSFLTSLIQNAKYLLFVHLKGAFV